jgi:hypothetical protein
MLLNAHTMPGIDIDVYKSESLLHARSNGSEVAIDLALFCVRRMKSGKVVYYGFAANTYGRATENEADNSLTGNVNVLEATQNVDLRVSQHHTSPAGVLNGKLGLSILASNTTNCTAKMLSIERLHILNLKSLDIQVIQSEKSNRIVDIEAEGESADKVCALLESANVRGELGGSEFYGAALDVHSDLELEVLDDRRADFGPVGFEGGHAVRRNGHLASLDAISGMGLLCRCENGATLFVDAHLGVGSGFDHGVGNIWLRRSLGIDQDLIILV